MNDNHDELGRFASADADAKSAVADHAAKTVQSHEDIPQAIRAHESAAAAHTSAASAPGQDNEHRDEHKQAAQWHDAQAAKLTDAHAAVSELHAKVNETEAKLAAIDATPSPPMPVRIAALRSRSDALDSHIAALHAEGEENQKALGEIRAKLASIKARRDAVKR